MQLMFYVFASRMSPNWEYRVVDLPHGDENVFHATDLTTCPQNLVLILPIRLVCIRTFTSVQKYVGSTTTGTLEVTSRFQEQMVEYSTLNHRTSAKMSSCLQRFQRSTSLKLSRKTTSRESQMPCSKMRQSRFNRTSTVVRNAFTFATKPVCKSAELLTRSRKRDRIRSYFARRSEDKFNEALLYLAEPAILSTVKEETRSSDDTEGGDDVYMVDCQSDSDSGDDSCFEGDFVTPPVIIPEMYRKQDRLGGVIVAGVRVLFTNAGFQRQQAIVHKLQPVPESSQLAVLIGMHHEPIVIRAF